MRGNEVDNAGPVRARGAAPSPHDRFGIRRSARRSPPRSQQSALVLAACEKVGRIRYPSKARRRALKDRRPATASSPAGRHADQRRDRHLRSVTGNGSGLHLPIVPIGPIRARGRFQWQATMCLPASLDGLRSCTARSPGSTTRSASRPRRPSPNGSRTVTDSIDVVPGFQFWSDGKPVNAQDLLFDVALIKAAVAESAANWAPFTPGYFPQSLQHQRDRPNTVRSCALTARSTRDFPQPCSSGNVFPLPSRSGTWPPRAALT